MDILHGSGSDERALSRLFGEEYEVSARLWHFTRLGEPFVNHITVFPLVDSGSGQEPLRISHYLGVMR